MLSLVVFCKMRPAFLPITHQKNFSLEFQGNDLVIPELLLNNTRWKPQFISFWFPEAELRACSNAVSFICPQLRESKDECCGPIGRICKHKQQQTAGIFQVNDEDLNGRPLNLHFAVFDWCALFRRMKHLSPVSLFSPAELWSSPTWRSRKRFCHQTRTRVESTGSGAEQGGRGLSEGQNWFNLCGPPPAVFDASTRDLKCKIWPTLGMWRQKDSRRKMQSMKHLINKAEIRRTGS